MANPKRVAYMRDYMRVYRARKREEKQGAEGTAPIPEARLPARVGDHWPKSRVQAAFEMLARFTGNGHHLEGQLVRREVARVLVDLEDAREALRQVGPVEHLRNGRTVENAWAKRERTLRKELIGLLRECHMTPDSMERLRLVHKQLM